MYLTQDELHVDCKSWCIFFHFQRVADYPVGLSFFGGGGVLHQPLSPTNPIIRQTEHYTFLPLKNYMTLAIALPWLHQFKHCQLSMKREQYSGYELDLLILSLFASLPPSLLDPSPYDQLLATMSTLRDLVCY